MNIIDDNKFKEIFPFPAARKGQREIIEKIINAFESGKTYVILSAPTGTGKSCIGYAVARYYENSYILTSQKTLQEQYYKDFNIPYVLGQENYSCSRNSSLTCANGVCKFSGLKNCHNCPDCEYKINQDICFDSPHSNLNYSYFLCSLLYTGKILPRELIICDECHNCENELINQFTITINDNFLKMLNDTYIELPEYSKSNYEKCKWLIDDFYNKIKDTYKKINGKLRSSEFKTEKKQKTKKFITLMNKFNIIDNYYKKLESFKQIINNEKIIVTQDVISNSIEFKLLHANKLFNNTIAKTSNRVLFMSATVLNWKVFIKNLGINEDNVEYIECECQFPVENRPIYYRPVSSMSYKNKHDTMPKMIKAIDTILKKYKNVKGIIHTVSYDVAQSIKENLNFSDQGYRLILPTNKTKKIDLERFEKSKEPKILISPSLTEGIDLKDDLSRLCIICKIPFPNLNNNWIKAKKQEDIDWYINQTCTTLIQMIGRSVRSETDYAKTYILDKDFEILCKNGPHIFPKYFIEALDVNY